MARCGTHGAVWNDQGNYCPECKIERLKGAMRADDERLRLAGERVGLVFGCDTPDAMAEEIETLRARLAEAEIAVGWVPAGRLEAAMARAEKAEQERDSLRRERDEAIARLRRFHLDATSTGQATLRHEHAKKVRSAANVAPVDEPTRYMLNALADDFESGEP